MEPPKYYCHHDDLVLSEQDIVLLQTGPAARNLDELDERSLRLVKAYDLWIATVRSSPRGYHKSDWTPSLIDIMKSRLFWWIRSGHEPLPYPPPCAYSCPWYEVIVENGNHHVFGFHLHEEDFDGAEGTVSTTDAIISQDRYNVIEKISDSELIVGFGPYRFRTFRDIELHARYIASINQHRPSTYDEVLADDSSKPDRGWFITRTKDLENPDDFLAVVDQKNP